MIRQSGSWLEQCKPFLAGGGRIEAIDDGARLILPSAVASRYADAQLDDYAGLRHAGLRRRDFPHRPPVSLLLRARFSHDNRPSRPPDFQPSLIGTAGFGFWNNPFGAQSRIPAPPRALWFFYASPPSDMALALGVPGFGWKAASIDASRPSALALAPFAPIVMLLCRRPRLYRALWHRVQRTLGISECRLPHAMTDWHVYELEWRRDGARWRIDGETAQETDRAPRGPLGFVAWIDNQYAVVTPRGKLGSGLLDAPFEQWLEIAHVELRNEA